MGKYKAVYDRYHTRYKEEFDTAKEAAQFLFSGEERGELSWHEIVDPKGKVIAKHSDDAAYKALEKLGAVDYETLLRD